MQRLLPAVEATSQGDDRESPPSANEALVTVGDSERAGWMSYRRIVGYYLKLTGRSEKQEEDQNQYITQGLIQCLILATLLTSESKYSSAYSYDLLNKNPRWDPAAVSMAIDLLRTHNSIVYTKGHPNTTVSVHIPKQLSDNASITDGSEALIGEGKTVPSQSQSANGDSDSQRGAPLAKRKRMQPRMPGRGFCVSDKFLLAIKGVFPNRLFIAQSHLAQRKWEAAILSDESGRGSDENAGNNGEGVLGERGSRAPGLFDFNPLLGSGEMAFLFSQLTTGAVYTLAKYPVVTNAHKAVRNSFKMGDVRMYDFNITFCVPWQAVEWLRKARDGLARENKSLEPPPLYNVLPAGTRLSSDAPGDNTQCQQQAADSVLEGAVVEEVRDAGMMGLDLISLKAQLLASHESTKWGSLSCATLHLSTTTDG
ncbi:hypothetical protein EV182_005793 [Spiromyces aspiralis]|uniref:Uncharacterized protein n=1 Tax=Spiromyces aspiralis TaxID=68401 RepID=A0ACC1HUQ0_9FUNG|nr:hypothetical protein EV182_005793 [Spiromyces aspiralis]